MVYITDVIFFSDYVSDEKYQKQPVHVLAHPFWKNVHANMFCKKIPLYYISILAFRKQFNIEKWCKS